MTTHTVQHIQYLHRIGSHNIHHFKRRCHPLKACLAALGVARFAIRNSLRTEQ
ncbi:Uncharacterised protein [Serratia fonticola]|jgi:hypothetical protein|uniref:hypothetical protein n=1 Tax=Serratia fonticola TaxID=47917 RepID=UPI00217ABDB1|nr:hypothetical protein [Serratia fonticola]CAI0698470.1 Uncharacterised protein [Serratia fonticola]